MATLLTFASSAKGRNMKQILTLCTVVSLLLIAGCNTVKGMGQDLKKAGEKIEGAAQK
jgi:predicted small secreted protein